MKLNLNSSLWHVARARALNALRVPMSCDDDIEIVEAQRDSGFWFMFIQPVALVVIFQPELRRGLLSLGEHKLFHSFAGRSFTVP